MDRHIADVIDLLLRGRVVPFLGAGVNLCSRPASERFTWSQPCEWLPSGAELAEYLAARFRYPVPEDCQTPGCPLLSDCDGEACPIRRQRPPAECISKHADVDLARVSQYGATRLGPGALYQELNEVFDRAYPVTDVHRFLASLAFPAPQARLAWGRHLLVVSTRTMTT